MWSDEINITKENYILPRNISSSSTKIVASGANGRCYGRLVARNIKTCIDEIFENAGSVQRRFHISPNALRETYIDKPRQVYGYHFRSFASGRVWVPPKTLIYNSTVWDKSKQGYIVKVCIHTNKVVALYESLKAAGEEIDLPNARKHSQNISYRLEKKIEYMGYIWRRATLEEYNTFVDL
jgi:hypothetical protein